MSEPPVAPPTDTGPPAADGAGGAAAPDLLDEAGALVGKGEWQRALEVLAGEVGASPPGLELRARAAYGAGDFEGSVAAWEELHSVLLAQDDRPEAARAAAMIALYLMMDTGLMAPVRGWLRRADRLLEGLEEVPAHAVTALVRTYERFMSGDMEAARGQAALAIDLGTRLGVQPAVVIGRVATARITILEGAVAEGLELLDEIGALLMSGAVDPLTTGMMYCELICAAQGLALHDRAAQWTQMMDRWRHGPAFGGLNGRCRVHRAEMLRITGPCDLAEEEALAACDELRPWMRREFGWPLTELGNIRLRRGDLDGAEEAFLAAHEHAWSPHPGLALLRLEQGDVAAASRLVADAIAHPLRIPSKERPPFGDLCLAPLLDAQAAIAAAAGDAATAGKAADALQAIADSYPSPYLAASAALARARSALLQGEVDLAITACGVAVATWADLGAPFEAAVARMVLGEAHDRLGNRDAARMEWRAAGRTFETFGARRWAERALLLIGGRPAPPLSAATTDAAVFSRHGDIRTISFAGTTIRTHDLKGFRYIERLLADPGREFHAMDLVAVEQGSLPAGPARREDGLGLTGHDGVPVLDAAALRAYRRRLAEVEEDIEEATRCNDPGRVELAQRDRDYLLAEVKRAVGLAGRHRSVGSNAERARISVTRTLRYALRRLADQHPALATHLEHSVKTGSYCSYTPEPLATVRWTL